MIPSQMLRHKNDFKDRHRLDQLFSTVVLNMGQLPSLMIINDIQTDGSSHWHAEGISAIIWRGTHEKNVVAIKVRHNQRLRMNTEVSGVFGYAEILLIELNRSRTCLTKY